ncbi:PREDICTED: protein PLANT CADMIUM RESISTANCE 5-like [Camelina sativa]|uniref:Protein PLANT CADMIUM RESISTANCE 5-like n=1 Tax=Camelina sativa TaxID=90675 RepID=A0ABM0W5G5_CAMSA|nr:PREDICTED: protein PLANT CADMIUM RESISTANCE 5-like [Camelina sativa]
MARPDGQPNQAQPQVQHTANQNNEVLPHNGATGNQANIPTGTPVNYQTQNRWSSQLFDCMNDSENAVITLLAPCVTFGQIAEIVDEGATPCATAGVLYGAIFFTGACFVYSHIFRAKIRNKYGLPDAPAPDWLTHLVCMPCALCQEYRELKHHGFDPIIGWAGNAQAQQQQMMAPPTSQRMMG